jgi:signal peptidase
MLRTLNRLATLIAVAAIAVTAATAAGVLAGPRLGYQALLMTTGSMRPAIEPGDLVILRSVDPASIRVGDVITFREPVGSHALVTHRVAAITGTPQAPVFRTKGDANQVADIWTIHYQATAWRQVGRIPGAGRVMASLATLPGRLLVMLLVFAIAMGLLLPSRESGSQDAAGAGVAT